ncbi:CDP-diacylglycerol--inositol 3-phosphatidyltransferase-like isoform X2 [Dinothrombium tinctorium]|uniref:CDP-diacylglycerol--inositol 3-phosphatidyltransferase n=1 Tax=Dinothrombium tinctorium TaxID=1965070 RepID=A0A3S3PXL2_9ACAR|nr:CDP-diacylglycerol--inositol 3-phosphatidyltransferase-like isoform X2 [Dinothrombium tinctorium]RWS02336.1 CDP-diacylglycerol--inositol 3-phosphatidyltransferase-like isoform X2 [Dinothrombium tinctorium]RWS02403.1 CDP-diacylglycerol--inositol 3-phosphatidyltransferase-like isoform X2 [Dinothrombium tinctorium]
MSSDYMKASVFYVLSAALDAIDGYAARLFNQSTKFGAILDQLTDRCGTMALLMALSLFYPKYLFFFQLANVIDISSHWIHIWSSMMQGKTSHKFIDTSGNPVLRLYYTNRPVLFFMCAGNELFYCALYLLHFTDGPFVPLVNQGLFKMLALISAPIAIVKLIISLIHLIVACINVGIIDVHERAEQRKTN